MLATNSTTFGELCTTTQSRLVRCFIYSPNLSKAVALSSCILRHQTRDPACRSTVAATAQMRLQFDHQSSLLILMPSPNCAQIDPSQVFSQQIGINYSSQVHYECQKLRLRTSSWKLVFAVIETDNQLVCKKSKQRNIYTYTILYVHGEAFFCNLIIVGRLWILVSNLSPGLPSERPAVGEILNGMVQS